MADPDGESPAGAQICNLAGELAQTVGCCVPAVLRCVEGACQFAPGEWCPPAPTPAAELNARCLVLSHHGRSMMRELLWGHVTMHATKFSQRPLVVLEPRHVGRA